jgi:hypothetical protein
MSDPIFLNRMTANEDPILLNSSCAEAVVTVLYHGRAQGWYSLLAFAVLPDELQLVVVPKRQQPGGIMRNIQSETTPLLAALLRGRTQIWHPKFRKIVLRQSDALHAQIENVHRAPVALGLSRHPADFPYCSANARFRSMLD